MSIKDKYNQYKEEKDRRDYFRKRNDLYVDHTTLLKTFFLALIVSTFVGIAIYYITSLIRIRSTYFYIVLGGIVGTVVKNISNVSSKQMGTIACICTVLGLILSNILIVGYYFVYGLGVSGIVQAIYYGIVSIFSDFFTLIFIAIGAYIAYITAR